MLFPIFGKRLRPRGFTWIPTTYDPEKEMSRPERMRFDKYMKYKRRRRPRQGNPALLMLLAIFIAVVMWYLDRLSDVNTEVEPVTIQVEDAVTAPPATDSSGQEPGNATTGREETTQHP